jgi:hypothetical protein
MWRHAAMAAASLAAMAVASFLRRPR